MKTLLVLFINFLFTPFIYAQEASELIVINHTTGGGDRYYNVWFSPNIKDLKINNAPPTKENPPDFYTDKYVIKQKSFLRIKKFILDNCNTISDINFYSDDYFEIKIVSGKRKVSCFLENKKVSKPYMEKLIEYIDTPPYKDDFKKFIIGTKKMLQWYDYVPPKSKI